MVEYPLFYMLRKIVFWSSHTCLKIKVLALPLDRAKECTLSDLKRMYPLAARGEGG